MKNFSELKSFQNFLQLFKKEKTQNNFYISPLFGSAKSFFIKKIIETENQAVVLLHDLQSVAELNVELNILGLEKKVIAFTEFTTETIQEKLTEISKRNKFILISSYELLNHELPTKKQVEDKTTKIQVGGEITYNDLIEYLNLLTYQKDKFVEAPGYFSQRGSIIDFWSYSEKNPVRLEFDGDFLESIRYFDPESQRSIELSEEATLAASFDETSSQNFSDIFEYLNEPVILASSFELKNLLDEKLNLFSEKDLKKEKDEKKVKKDFTDITNEKEFEEFPEFPEPLKNEDNPDLNLKAKTFFDENFFSSLIEKENTRWIMEEEIDSANNRINLGFSEAPSINGNYEILFNVLKEYAQKSFEVIITSENELQTARLKDLLSEFKDELAQLIDVGKIKLETLPIKKGFLHNPARQRLTDNRIQQLNSSEILEEKFLLLTDYQIFNKPYRTKISSNKKYKRSKSKQAASIKRGDYVVHEDYGIGKYVGLQTIKIGESDQETMKILYREGGVVYVNL
ncbi:MAG: CarD family transcriptional regulator, partial [Ignavibacteriaceae bacterium]